MSETIEYKGYTIKIEQDEHSSDPREFGEPLGNMVCFHSGYTLGDKHTFKEPKDITFFVEHCSNAVSLPLYLYEHSGITMNTTGFSCQWDSGKVGYIYVMYGDIKTAMGWKYVTKQRVEKIKEYLKAEVEEYDNFLTGNVYGYSVTNKDEEEIEDGSCWGFYGYDHEKSGLMEAAKEVIDVQVMEDEEVARVQSASMVELPLIQNELKYTAAKTALKERLKVAA